MSALIDVGPLQLLGTFKYGGKAVDSHLVVVAATDPSPEASPGVKQFPWFLAAKEIVSVRVAAPAAV